MQPENQDQRIRLFSRREFVKLARDGGILLVVPQALGGDRFRRDAELATSSAKAPLHEGNQQFLTEAEAAMVEAISDRIIPSDEIPGAREAGVVHFIDHMLATDYRAQQSLYRNGMRRVDELACIRFGSGFLELTPSDQDLLLAQMERGEIGDWKEAREFFSTVRTHTIEGMFSDPKYGGNAGGVGWKLIDL